MAVRGVDDKTNFFYLYEQRVDMHTTRRFNDTMFSSGHK